ncbi:amidase [Chloroflexota bacterium]
MVHDSLTLSEQRELIKSGQMRGSDLSEACYSQIERLNPMLNAFITVIPPESGEPPLKGNYPLCGLPIAVKDLYNVKGFRTTGGSKFFADYIPSKDAYVVEKIKKAGGRIIGKTNTHEVALGVTNKNPHYGACRNPWDVTRIPGGSSGGSAVAVAADMALAAIGTDTGGSIRIPASLCGVVGLKPTYGRISSQGIMPLSWNLDHAGPITKRVEDAALMLQVMSGYDPEDPASVKTLPGDFQSHMRDPLQDRKVAFAVGDFIEEMADPDISEAVRTAAKVFASLGVTIEEVNMDFLREAALANSLMTQADGAAFHRERLKEHPDWFGADVRQRLETGARFTSSEYILARRIQAEVRRRCDIFFEEYNTLILPTTPISAPLLEGEDAIERALILTRFTSPFNLTGLPAISVPCGFTDGNLPIGLQIVSRAWNESGVLRMGYHYQEATDWHKKKPDIVNKKTGAG